MAVSTEDFSGASHLRLPPGPKGSPFLGSALDLKNDLLGTVHRAMLEYGDVVRFTVGPSGRFQQQAFGVFHPEHIQHVLAAGSDHYVKGDGVYIELRGLLGDGLLTSEGEDWKRQKRMIQPIFTHRRVASYVPMMGAETAGAVARWTKGRFPRRSNRDNETAHDCPPQTPPTSSDGANPWRKVFSEIVRGFRNCRR